MIESMAVSRDLKINVIFGNDFEEVLYGRSPLGIKPWSFGFV